MATNPVYNNNNSDDSGKTTTTTDDESARQQQTQDTNVREVSLFLATDYDDSIPSSRAAARVGVAMQLLVPGTREQLLLSAVGSFVVNGNVVSQSVSQSAKKSRGGRLASYRDPNNNPNKSTASLANI